MSGRGLQVSRGDVLEHLLFKRQIGNQTLQANILAFQVLHPLRLIDLKATVFLAPAVIALLRYPASRQASGADLPCAINTSI
jgi:hypothetical protein